MMSDVMFPYQKPSFGASFILDLFHPFRYSAASHAFLKRLRLPRAWSPTLWSGSRQSREPEFSQENFGVFKKAWLTVKFFSPISHPATLRNNSI